MRITWTKKEDITDMWIGEIEGSPLVATVTDITCGDYEVEVRLPDSVTDDFQPVFLDWLCHANAENVLASAEKWINAALA
jgi:hypothetical protein